MRASTLLLWTSAAVISGSESAYAFVLEIGQKPRPPMHIMARRGKGDLKRSLEGGTKNMLPNDPRYINGGKGQEITGVSMPSESEFYCFIVACWLKKKSTDTMKSKDIGNTCSYGAFANSTFVHDCFSKMPSKAGNLVAVSAWHVPMLTICFMLFKGTVHGVHLIFGKGTC